MKLTNKLLKVRENILVKEQEIKKLEDEYLSAPRLELEALQSEEEELRSNLVQEMKKDNVKTLEEGDYSFLRSAKTDLKIENEETFKTYVLDNVVSLKPYLSDKVKTKDELIELIMPRKFSLTNAKTLAKRALDISEEVLPGFKLESTEYLTVRSKKEKEV